MKEKLNVTVPLETRGIAHPQDHSGEYQGRSEGKKKQGEGVGHAFIKWER